MNPWAAFRRTGDHVLGGAGKATIYEVVFCHAYEAAHKRYLRDVGVYDGDDAAIFKRPDVPLAAPVHVRRDKMVPHPRKWPIYQKGAARGQFGQRWVVVVPYGLGRGTAINDIVLLIQ